MGHKVSLKLVSFKNQKEFDQLNDSSTKLVCKYFILILQKKSEEKPIINLGLKVGRKVGNAVIRNKIRRRLKHIIREFVINNTPEEWFGSKFLIVPKKSIINAVYSDMLLDLGNRVKAIAK